MTDMFSTYWDGFFNRTTDENRRKTAPFSAIFSNFSISPHLQLHLFNVYSTLALMLLAATMGSIIGYNSVPRPWLWSIGQFVAIICFYLTNPYSQFLNIVNTQSMLLYTIATISGILISPVLEMAVQHDPLVLPLAFAATTIVFASFTLVALKADRVSVLYAYSTFALAFGALSFFALTMSLFGTSLLPPMMWICFGMASTLFMIVLDTQNMIYRYEQSGDSMSMDYKQDALALFWNFLKLFVRIVHLIMQNTKKRDDDDRERNRNRNRRN